METKTYACKGHFNRVATQWHVTENQRKLCMPYCFSGDASRIFEEIANAMTDASSEIWWQKMQVRVFNQAQAQAARQEF